MCAGKGEKERDVSLRHQHHRQLQEDSPAVHPRPAPQEHSKGQRASQTTSQVLRASITCIAVALYLYCNTTYYSNSNALSSIHNRPGRLLGDWDTPASHCCTLLANIGII